MKLSPRDAPAYFAKPDPNKAGVLIFGGDAMRVSLKRQQLIKALLGPNAEEEMRLSRMTAAELRKDSATLLDAVKAVGFFPGPRVALVEDATDGLDVVIGAALDEWQPGDAQIVVTAGQLAARAKLRKRFEGRAETVAIGIYDDPPSRGEIEGMLAEAGLRDVPKDASDALFELARSLDPGDFRQTVEKIALYKLSDEAPLSPEDIALMAPATIEAGVDDLLNLVTERQVPKIGPVLRRLEAQGTNPVTLTIQATRHFKQLHQVRSDPGGPGSGIGKLRPPVFGPRRDRMMRQASAWSTPSLELALGSLLETDLTLRSAAKAPEMAVVERALLKIAHMKDRR